MIHPFTKFLLALAFLLTVSLPFVLVFDHYGKLDHKRSKAKVHQTAVPSQELVHHYAKPFQNSPVVQEYAQETKRLPRVVPESLRIFVANLGQEMNRARSELGDGLALFEKLATCAAAGDRNELLIVRTVCAENARSLAEIYPEQLAVKFEKLTSRLDERVRVLVN